MMFFAYVGCFNLVKHVSISSLGHVPADVARQPVEASAPRRIKPRHAVRAGAKITVQYSETRMYN